MARCCQPSPCSRSSAYTLALGLGFISLGTTRILLLKLSANAENKYDFLPASVNLMAEGIKLVFCIMMSLRVIVKEGRPCRELGFSSCPEFLSFMKWSIPAFLYFLDNLIIFYVLTYLQPALAVLFSNFVILTTAILFRIVLKRRLSTVQWASLVILFLSMVALSMGTGGSQHATEVHGLHPGKISVSSNSCLAYTHLEAERLNLSAADRGGPLAGGSWNVTLGHDLHFGLGHVLLLLQCFISSMANIYNEKILKEGDQLAESIFIQNSRLYVFGVVFNTLSLALHSDSRSMVLHCGLLHGHNTYSLALAVVTAALGLSVAFILKFRDNMFHVLTSQVTTVLVTTISLLAFDFQPSLDFFLQAPVVMLAIFIYNTSRARDPEFALQQEKLRVINGEMSERSRGVNSAPIGPILSRPSLSPVVL